MLVKEFSVSMGVEGSCSVVCSRPRGQKELFTQPASVWHWSWRAKYRSLQGQGDLGMYLHVSNIAKVFMWDIRNEYDSAAKLIPLLKNSLLLIIFSDFQEKCFLQLFWQVHTRKCLLILHLQGGGCFYWLGYHWSYLKIDQWTVLKKLGRNHLEGGRDFAIGSPQPEGLALRSRCLVVPEEISLAMKTITDAIKGKQNIRAMR